MQPGIGFSYGGFPSPRGANVAHTAFGDSGVAGNHWTEQTQPLTTLCAERQGVGQRGLYQYAFPNFNEGRYSNEIYGAISVDTILQPSFAAYGDMHNGDGMYYLLGVGHSVDVGSGVALNLSAALGVNQGQWIEKTAVSDVMLGVALTLPMGTNVTLQPFLYLHYGRREFENLCRLFLLHRFDRRRQFEH